MEYVSEVVSLLFSGLYLMGNWNNILLVFIGTGIGVFFGSLPGISSTMSLVVFTPLTFPLSAPSAMLFLLALYVGAVFGGAIAAITVNIPGTPGAILTCVDGYPCCKRGEAGKAISVATISSSVGTICGLIFLVLISPLFVKFIKHFGTWEYAALALLGLSIVSYVAEGPTINGIIGGLIGLLISTIGYDPVDAYPRFSFGLINLTAGVDIIVALIGMFGFAEIIAAYSQDIKKIKPTQKLKIDYIDSIKTVFKYRVSLIRSSIMGVLVGIIPAAGGNLAGFPAYAIAKQRSKEPEKFGKGHYEGIVVSESSNNAGVGGAVIPMITLGIPGDPMTAVLIGALMLHGLTPGPLLFELSPDVVSSIYLSIGLSTIFLLIWGLIGTHVFVRVLAIPPFLLYPTIILFCIIGTYVIRNSVFDVATAILFGIGIFFLKKIKISSLPIMLGLILGPMLEENLRRALVLGGGSIIPFFTRPISLLLILSALFLFIIGIAQANRLFVKDKKS